MSAPVSKAKSKSRSKSKAKTLYIPPESFMGMNIDTVKEILYKLPPENLPDMCATSKFVSVICADPFFRKEYLKRWRVWKFVTKTYQHFSNKNKGIINSVYQCGQNFVIIHTGIENISSPNPEVVFMEIYMNSLAFHSEEETRYGLLFPISTTEKDFLLSKGDDLVEPDANDNLSLTNMTPLKNFLHCLTSNDEEDFEDIPEIGFFSIMVRLLATLLPEAFSIPEKAVVLKYLYDDENNTFLYSTVYNILSVKDVPR
jgi:hypothetical protein